MLQPGPLVWMEDSGPAMTYPRPRCTVSIESAMEFLSAPSALPPPDRSKNSSGLWLHGVCIIDLTNIIAGPHSSAFLSRFGAEVIKLELVEPTYEPLVASAFTFLTDIGKKKGLLDIRTGKGKEAFHKLLRSADVVTINAVDRQFAALGLGETSLKAINPDLIFCRLDAFGGPVKGTSRSSYIGYDDVRLDQA